MSGLWTRRCTQTYTRTWSCGLAHPSSFGTINRNPELEASVPLPVTRSRSPSRTPGHHDWLNMTVCDSLGSCTHELKTFESPTFRAGAETGVLRTDVAVFDRRRVLYCVCWDSALDVVMKVADRFAGDVKKWTDSDSNQELGKWSQRSRWTWSKLTHNTEIELPNKAIASKSKFTILYYRTTHVMSRIMNRAQDWIDEASPEVLHTLNPDSDSTLIIHPKSG